MNLLKGILQWFNAKLESKSSSLFLVVEGEIIEKGRHQPRTHLGPSQAEEEAYFTLQIRQARFSDGRTSSRDLAPPEFSGEIGLLEAFEVGDSVQIVTTTPTGRQIATMTPVDFHGPPIRRAPQIGGEVDLRR